MYMFMFRGMRVLCASGTFRINLSACSRRSKTNIFSVKVRDSKVCLSKNSRDYRNAEMLLYTAC